MRHVEGSANQTDDFAASNGTEEGPFVNETGVPVTDDAKITREEIETVTNEATETETESRVVRRVDDRPP